MISGKPVQVGGYLHQADEVYSALHGQVDLMLLRKTTVHIDLKAQPKDGAVAVTAEANGSFAATDPVRLRLVLAEERVGLRGSNGVREHDMVVRAMPGGTSGIELKDGKLRYEGKIDLKTIKREIDDYLRAYEEANKTTFPIKPLDLARPAPGGLRAERPDERGLPGRLDPVPEWVGSRGGQGPGLGRKDERRGAVRQQGVAVRRRERGVRSGPCESRPTDSRSC